jgi:hypothetical protein
MIDPRVLNDLNGLSTLLLFVMGGAALLGHARKLSHDLLIQSLKDWQELAASRLAINEGLRQQLDAIQTQVSRHAEQIATMEHDRGELQRLNQRLQVRMERLVAENERLRARMQELGLPWPPAGAVLAVDEARGEPVPAPGEAGQMPGCPIGKEAGLSLPEESPEADSDSGGSDEHGVVEGTGVDPV